MSRYQVEELIEGERGCGFRKPGGLYLVGDGPPAKCCQLPFELHVCPTCGQGIKPTRGWTWIIPRALFKQYRLDDDPCDKDPFCALPRIVDRISVEFSGLLWIGEKYYKTDKAFVDEARVMGMSRRIAQVPREFELGRTWVFLAHRKTQFEPPAGIHTEIDPEDFRRPAIFAFFRPSRIEYVIDPDNDTPAKLEKLAQRGITLVEVHKRQTEIDYVARP
jgi:hypothetical protein